MSGARLLDNVWNGAMQDDLLPDRSSRRRDSKKKLYPFLQVNWISTALTLSPPCNEFVHSRVRASEFFFPFFWEKITHHFTMNFHVATTVMENVTHATLSFLSDATIDWKVVMDRFSCLYCRLSDMNAAAQGFFNTQRNATYPSVSICMPHQWKYLPVRLLPKRSLGLQFMGETQAWR